MTMKPLLSFANAGETVHRATVESDALALSMATTQLNERSSDLIHPVSERVSGIVVGKLVDFDELGRPIVSWAENWGERRQTARTTVPLLGEHPGAEVTLAVPSDKAQPPIVLGVVLPDTPSDEPIRKRTVELDGERLEFNAETEIVLRCGKSSMTLTRAGKVIIRGAYLLSRSQGVNLIKGGSVQIN